MKATVEIEKINPNRARELLSTLMDGQRHLRENAVEMLAREMSAGNFRLSCDAIVILNGQLANGQHRLSAVTQSNTTQQFLVMRSDDQELYKVIDCGIKRTVADVAGVANGNQVAAIGSWVIGYDARRLTLGCKVKRIPRTEMITFIQKHDTELQEIHRKLVSIRTRQAILPLSISGAFLMIAGRTDPDKAFTFISGVYSGDVKDATWDVRERLIKNKLSAARLHPAHVFALLIKGYKSYLQGTRPGVLRMTEGEEFPRLV